MANPSLLAKAELFYGAEIVGLITGWYLVWANLPDFASIISLNRVSMASQVAELGLLVSMSLIFIVNGLLKHFSIVRDLR